MRNRDAPRLTGGLSLFTGNWSSKDYETLGRALTHIRTAAAMPVPERATFRIAGTARQTQLIEVLPVSGSYFHVLGGRPLLGRTLTPEDDQPGAPPVVCLSQSFWATRLAHDPAVVGTAIWLDEHPYTIVGLLERGFHGLTPAIYLPLSPINLPSAHMVVSTHGAAEPVARPIRDALLSADPHLQPTVRLIRDGVDQELEKPAAVAASAGLLAVTAMVLAAIGLFGVTTFMVNQRRHEVSVRMALGATGSAIVRMLLRDSLRPVAAGMACGLGLAVLVGQVISRLLYGISGHDPIAMTAAVLLLLAAALAAALYPATRAARTNPADMLKQS